MASRPIQRLLSVLRRELGASRVGLATRPDEVPGDEAVVALGLPHGLTMWALVPASTQDRSAVRARMELVAESFAHLLETEAARARARTASPSTRLRRVLRRLATAAGACDALVLDTRSPMIWGAASGVSGEVLGPPHLRVVAPDEQADEASRSAEQERFKLSRHVISEVRSLPVIGQLPRGAHLRRSVRAGEAGYLVRSFASIYLLVLVFPGPFDELRGEREAARALPAVESLVLALPPPEPVGTSSALALRKRR
jgi:hypothetical protein